MAPPTFDVAAAQRWFAIEFNNGAWDLVEAASRSPAEADRMLHLAHAALAHWQVAGTEVNRQRALVLLSFVHVLGGSPKLARHYADQAVGQEASLAGELTPFDRAAAAIATQVALRSAGQEEQAEAWTNRIQALLGEVDPDDRPVLRKLLELKADARTD